MCVKDISCALDGWGSRRRMAGSGFCSTGREQTCDQGSQVGIREFIKYDQKQIRSVYIDCTGGTTRSRWRGKSINRDW